MKLLIVLSLLMSSLAFAQDGKRVITLNCSVPVSCEQGDMLIGGAGHQLKISLDTNRSKKIEVISTYPFPPFEEKTEEAKHSSRGFGEMYVLGDKKIFLFRETNCLKGPISAIISEHDVISSCAVVVKDEFTGKDFDFCLDIR